jgi:uncharacterized protein (DUF927 family)
LKRRIPDVARVASDLYGIEFRNGVARCPFPGKHSHGDRDPSLRYDRKKDRIFCASQLCFGEQGADAIGLVRFMENCNFLEAIQKLAEYYGVSATNSGAPPPRAKPARQTAGPTDAPAHEKPVPADIARKKLQRQGFLPVAEFEYGPQLRKVRFEHETDLQEGKKRPAKTYRWEHLSDGAWYSTDGGLPKPLYVNAVFRERDQLGLVIGFEGEAKADTAGALGLAAFSFKDITREQAATLAECDVVLWPDNDDSGLQQRQRAAQTIASAGQARGIRVLTPPTEFPLAGDIIDALRDLGWDRQRVDQFLETAATYSGPTAESSDPSDGTSGPETAKQRPANFPFDVSDEGVFFLKKDDKDETTVPIRIASRIDVVAKTRDGSGENWGRLLRWRDQESNRHEWAMPMEALAAEQSTVRARLLAEGLPFITTNAHYRERFSEYLQNAPTARMVRCVARVGWYGHTYVLPDCAISSEGSEEILYQTHHDTSNCWRIKGTLEDWREHVGRFCSGNSRLLLAAACGFAGPLLGVVGTESGGVHIYGATTTGKTTALVVGGSVCGGGGKAGFVQTWRTTINGLEATAEAHNDGTLFLDELSQVDPRDAAETAYLLANGQGKARMTRSIAARRKLAWTLLIVSSGEMTLAEHASSAGKQVKGGVEVRLISIEADAGKDLGLFENLHGFESAAQFANQLKAAAQRHYGTPIRAFLERLVKDRSEVERRVRRLCAIFLEESVPAGATGEVRRVAGRLSLIAAAGDLATEWGITGWEPGEATKAAQECFRNWLDRRGTAGASDVEAGFRQVRIFIESNGPSRFQQIGSPARETAQNEGVPPVRDRVGFRRWNLERQEAEYLVFPDMFKTEICKGQSARAVLNELDKRGFLVRDGQNLTIKVRVPEGEIARLHCIRGAILGGEDAGPL